MASLCCDPNGLKRVFVFVDGRREKVHLGKMAKGDAERSRDMIERLLSAKLAQSAPAPFVSEWLAVQPDRIHRRLVKLGLAEPRVEDIEAAEAAAIVKLGAFVDGYIQERGDTKESTRAIYEVVRENAVEFFGADKHIDKINAGDAEDFRRWLSVTKKLAPNTCKRRCAIVKQFLAYAVKKHLIPSNPFAVLRNLAVHENRERFVFIDRETIGKVLDKIVDPEWRLMVALSRFGGLRCPSEHLSLRWADIIWDESVMVVRQPKLEHCEGLASRRVPIFPELMPFLTAAQLDDEADPEWVIGRYRDTRVNLRKRLTMYIEKAGLKAWPRLWHALRASRQTELCAAFPVKAVCEWLGNSALVASRHYLMTTPADWERAITTPTPIQEAMRKDISGAPATPSAEPSPAPAREEQRAQKTAHYTGKLDGAEGSQDLAECVFGTGNADYHEIPRRGNTPIWPARTRTNAENGANSQESETEGAENGALRAETDSQAGQAPAVTPAPSHTGIDPLKQIADAVARLSEADRIRLAELLTAGQDFSYVDFDAKKRSGAAQESQTQAGTASDTPSI